MRRRKSSSFFLALLVIGGLLWHPRDAASAQYRDPVVDGAGAPVIEATDQFVITLNPTSRRGAVDTAFWRQFSDVSARSFGPTVSYKRQQNANVHVLKTSRKMNATEITALQRDWKQINEVAMVEPDIILHAAAVPNDPEYGQQWDMVSPLNPISGITYFGMNATGAWDAGYSGTGAIVSIIDTGITPHPDLAGQVVAQYDFISSATMANDGNGRDADATDAGDYEIINGVTYGSSWHGTHVAGTIAALRDNGVGVAGIANGAKLMIGRVLGAGGGYSTDIADAIRWSARLAVTGVPLPARRANVINMSLGGSSTTCPSVFASAIADATAAGTLVVVAAGNSATDAQNATPANCTQAVTVAATGPTGGKASYSNYGSVVDIAAPGGNSGDWVTHPRAGATIRSTLWSGQTTLASGSASYANYQGTSMAAPHVAGVAALLYGIKPAATIAEITAALRANVTTFPLSSCNTSNCGTGILNAGKATDALQRSVATLTPSPVVTPSTTFTPSQTATATATYTPSATRTATTVPSATNTPTNTAVPTETNTPTETLSPTITLTPSETLTPSNTLVPTITRTPTQILRLETNLYESFDVISSFSRVRHSSSGAKLRCRYPARTCIAEVSDGAQNSAGHISSTNTTTLQTASALTFLRFPSVLASIWVRTAEDGTVLMAAHSRSNFAMKIVAGFPVCSYTADRTTVNVTGTTMVTDSKWHQIACLLTPGSSTGVALFVDGVADGTPDRMRSIVYPTSWMVGSDGRTYANLDVDELVIASGRIDQNTISTLYNQQAPVGAILIPTRTATASKTPYPTKTPSPTKTATATRTATATATSTPLPTETFAVPPTATPADGDVLNPDFELGNASWSEGSNLTPGSRSIAAWSGFPAWFGTVFAWIGGVPSEVASVSQTITVPASAPFLQVHQGMASYERDCALSQDKARFKVNGTVVREWTLCNKARWATLAEYDTLEFDLRAYSGQSVTFTFEVANDAFNVSSWYLDTVHFVASAATASVRNGDFEARGDGSWAENSREFGGVPGQIVRGGVAKFGSYMDDSYKLTSRRISQYVDVPAGTQSLVFGITSRTIEFCGGYYDVLTIEVNEAVVGRIDICRTMRPGQWAVDMTPFAGSRVKIGFGYVTDSSLTGEVTVDDAAFSTAAAGAIKAPLAVLKTPPVVVKTMQFQK